MTNLDNLLQNNLISFDKKNDFYFVQIFKRRKDHPDLEHPVVRLKCYTITTKEEFLALYPRMVQYCEEHDARAYIRLNRQNMVDVSMRCIEEISKNLRKGHFHKNVGVWNSVAGQDGVTDYWILDIDWEHLNHNMLIIQDIKNILEHHFTEQRKEEFFFVKNQTKSGYHLIVKPFDTRILNTINKQFTGAKIPVIQIQKDANTLLYFKD